VATLKIQVKDSKFVSHNGVNIEEFAENYVKGNSWECRITENGRLDCIATEFYNKGERHQIKLKIDKGYAKVLLKIGDGRHRVLKTYRLEMWPQDGIIVLPTGFIDKRHPYFRNTEFQKFLDEFGLTAVKHESANGIYQVMMEHNGHAVVFNEDIETDGRVTEISVETHDESKDGQFCIKRMLEVTDATWVIKNVWRMNKYQHRILYTIDNPKEIVGLPKPE